MSATVTVRPIRSDSDLDAVQSRLDEIGEAEPGTDLGDEREHCPVGPSDPVEALPLQMDRLGLKQADLIPSMGAISRGVPAA